ncbi:Uncharacterised protein [Acinetobacter baumannii]|nr:Uncharacterised protein [Acinetobacter baumannii]
MVIVKLGFIKGMNTLDNKDLTFDSPIKEEFL